MGTGTHSNLNVPNSQEEKMLADDDCKDRLGRMLQDSILVNNLKGKWDQQFSRKWQVESACSSFQGAFREQDSGS